MLGREAELRLAKDLLWNPDIRLVTLLGPGGMGKTRLAVEVAWQLFEGPGFDDGVWFVDLASVPAAELVPGAIAAALGVHDPTMRADERLLHALSGRDLLLVLDNFERVTEAAAFVAELLASAARLSVLVTSRLALRLRAEHRIEVPPLPTPDAVALFEARARAVNPGFTLDDATAEIVTSICGALDGLPLAIELASARSRLLTPAALHARLGRDGSLLSGGPADHPDRLRSVDAAIAWSYDMLSPSAQGLFRRLSAFPSGWTVEAAEAVAGDDTSVLDDHAALLDHQLVRPDSGTIGNSVARRFHMFETVREFADRRLQESGEADAVCRRCAEHLLGFLSEANVELAKPDQARWLDLVEAEHGNISATLVWALAAAPDVALDIAAAMSRFWLLRGHTEEALSWLERALAAAAPSPSPARGAVLLGAGSVLEAMGDDTAAEARYRDALTIAETLDDAGAVATACRHLGNAALGQGLYRQAAYWYERTRSIGSELGDHFLIAGAVSNLGGVAYYQGDLTAAEARWREAATHFRDLGDPSRLAVVLNNLAELAALRGDADEAVRIHEEVLVVRQRLRDPISLAQTMANLGHAVHLSGDPARARPILEEALDRLQALGIQRDAGACLYNLALLERAERRLEDAFDHAAAGLAIKVSTGEEFDAIQCVELIAGLAADRGLGTRAARLLGAAASHRRRLEARPFTDEAEAAATYEAVRRMLGESALSAAMREGGAWDFEHAVADATELALTGRRLAAAVEPERALAPTHETVRLGLTTREVEVLGYVMRRYSNREIADALTISERTVTTHVSRILMKLGVDGRREAAAAASRLGLRVS
jgi:predicted ATPase/DNA-binding NarL/FixJ family response regulator